MGLRTFLAEQKEKALIFLYAFPNIIKPALSISSKTKSILQQLKKNGVIQYNAPYLEKITEHVTENYFNKIKDGSVSQAESLLKRINKDLFIQESYPDGRKNEYTAGGTEISHYISFKDEIISKLFLDEELIKIIFDYYGRQPYYRNKPLIQQIAINESTTVLENGRWHVDHFRQISFMLLLSDITEKDTHMQYILGSHLKKYQEGLCSDKLVRELVDNNPSRIFKLIGKKGTLFVFDATGVHRGNYQKGNTRRILHVNITTGRHIICSQKENYQNWNLLNNKPSYIKNMFKKM